VWAARVANGVAEKQLEAANAALRNELASVLVVSRGSVTNDEGQVRVFNGGRYAAIDLRLVCEDETGKSIGGAGRTPIVVPMSEAEVKIALGSPELRDAFGQMRKRSVAVD
jgi:hypothetical protein